ncbi:MAG: hypothetical protein IJB41_04660, partial [Clostridia bacterium]|nr:hypothetical protein [Clostridia bacterium]
IFTVRYSIFQNCLHIFNLELITVNMRNKLSGFGIIIRILRLLCLFGPIARLRALRLLGRIKAGAKILCALRMHSPVSVRIMEMPGAPGPARPAKCMGMFCAPRLWLRL